MQYTWDPAGNLTSMTYPDGNTVTFAYDSQNDMSSLTDWIGKTTGFKYDGAGSLSEIDYSNGTTTTYSYDSAERLDKIATAGTTQFSFDASGTYGLGPDGNVQNMTTSQTSSYGLTPGSSGAPGTDGYQYDPLQRLTTDKQTGASGNTWTNSYANNGEIKSATGSTMNNGSYTYQGTTGHDAGQLQTAGSNLSFGYDANGNRTSCTGPTGSSVCGGTGSLASSSTYGYDAQNRLTQWTNGTTGRTDSFTYDGNGELQQTKVQWQQNSCTYSPTAEPIGLSGLPLTGIRPEVLSTPYCTDESDLTWSTALGDPNLAVVQSVQTGMDQGHTDYVMGPDGQPVEQLSVSAGGGSSTPEWYYLDFQGNSRVLEDASGSVQSSENYPPFGQAVKPGSTGSVSTPLQYAGSYVDGSTGFVYDQARWYDPSTGQFLSQDPMVDQTLQPYEYAGDSPTNSSDPTGLCDRNSTFPRWHVKNARDPWARHHTTFSPEQTVSVTDYRNIAAHKWQRPTHRLKQRRYNPHHGVKHPVEMTFWKVTGWVHCNIGHLQNECVTNRYAHGQDGDLTFDLTENKHWSPGAPSVHCEMPDRTCDARPWKSRIDAVRNKMYGRNFFNKPNRCPRGQCHGGFKVTVVGLGFWDTGHHDRHVELHPILSVHRAK